MEKPDVIVVGGGPAGSTTAALLARAGVRTVLVERDLFPRFHVGEALLPASWPTWKRLDILDKLEGRYLQSHGVRFLCSRTQRSQTYAFADAAQPSTSSASSASHAFQVPRADFDDLLLNHAQQSGVKVMQGWSVTDATLGAGPAGCVVRARDESGRTQELRSRLVVDATGGEALVASRVCSRQRIPLLDKSALFSHFTGVVRQTGRDEGNLDVVTFPHGWMWNIPFRGGVNSVGMVCSSTWMRSRPPGESLDRFFDRSVDDSSWARSLLARARRINPVRFAGDYAYRVDSLGGDGWLAVGDATGFVDPLFSNGTNTAFVSASLASDEIVSALGTGDVTESRWARYSRVMRDAQDLAIELAQVFYGGGLHERIFGQVQRRAARQMFASILSGDVFDASAPWVRDLRETCAEALGPRAVPAGA